MLYDWIIVSIFACVITGLPRHSVGG